LDQMGLPYFADFATLMNVLREEEINSWDHDADVGMEWPPPYSTKPTPTSPALSTALYHRFGTPSAIAAGFGFYSPPHISFSDFRRSLEDAGYAVTYIVHRDLFQIRRDADVSVYHQPHFDIWMWRRTMDSTTTQSVLYAASDDVLTNRFEENNLKWLKVYAQYDDQWWGQLDEVSDVLIASPEDSVIYWRRKYDSMYPFLVFPWLRRNISAPFDCHEISAIEYGYDYMTPVVMRRDCLHNMVQRRWNY